MQAEWEVIRTTPQFQGSTGTFLVPDDIRHRTDINPKEGERLAIKLQGIIEEQVELAIPSSDLEGKAFFLGSTKPGTIHGELWRSGIMFKNFGISLNLGQFRRVQSIRTMTGRAVYAANFMAMMTMMGALAIQLKEVI